MAFPTVAGRTNSQVVTDGTTHAVSLPAGTIASGDLLIVHFVVDGNPTLTWPTDWVQTVRAHADGTASRSIVAYKIADGTEGSSINVSSSASEKSCHRSWHITGWHGTTVPEMDSSVQSAAAPDPPSLSPSWGAADTLWLALEGHENSGTSITGYPGSYTNTFTQNTTGGAGSAATNVVQGCAERQLNTATEDPGAFALDGSRVSATFTLAIRPGAGGGTTVNGTGLGAFTFGSTAVGTPTTPGSGAGAFSFTATASGTPEVFGAATGAYSFTGSATGTPETFGTAAASLSFTGAAAGVPDVQGTAAASLTFTGAASGVVEGAVSGTGLGAYTFTGQASGTPDVHGAATASLTFGGAASGVRVGFGQAVTSITFDGTATGTHVIAGQGAAALVFTGAASGAGSGDIIPDPYPAHDVYRETSHAVYQDATHDIYREGT